MFIDTDNILDFTSQFYQPTQYSQQMWESKQYPKPPSHRTFTFGPIIIDSDFDGGNCSHVQKISHSSYQLWIGTDNPKNSYRTWFYFSVVGFGQGSCVSFKIKNMQNQVYTFASILQSKLLGEGLVPVYREENSKEWKRIRDKINMNSIEYNQGWIEWTFRHTFTSAQKVYIAFFYPWSNEDNHHFLNRIQEKIQAIPNVYFYRNSIINSLEGRGLQFVVISSNLHRNSKEQKIEDKALFQGKKKPLSFYENKKGIVLSARVHPGQLPGSHVMNGIIEQLTENSEKSRLLRDNFVFYIFPILNPDGVARGHYRVDTNGINLNRCYINPNVKNQPTIYAIRNFILHLHNNNRFYAFLDLHAHASRRGTFIYGNSLNELQKQIDTCIFPKILSMNSMDFEYEGSNFTEQNMYCKEKGDHMSKQGSGRVAMYKATKNPFCWTLECNYNMSRVHNILEPRLTRGTKQQKPSQNQLNAKIIINFRNQAQKEAFQFFTIETFHKLGRQICQSFLDMIEKNPESRIDNLNNYFQSVQNLKLYLGVALLRMAPTRFQPHFRKVYSLINSQNPQIVSRSLQALYHMVIKNSKITNITAYIKDGDTSTLIVESPKKAKSASVGAPKYSSLLERPTAKQVKEKEKERNDGDQDWKSQKNIQKCNIDLLDLRSPNRQSLSIEPDINWLERSSNELSQDKIQNIICQKLKLYQIEMKSHRTTSLRLQNTKILDLGTIKQNIVAKQRALSPVKINKLRFSKQTQLPILGKKNSLGTPHQESPKKYHQRGDFVRDPLLFIQAD